MHRLLALWITVLLLSPALASQDEDKLVDPALAFPSTTLLFASVDLTELTADLTNEDFIESLGADIDIPDLGKLLSEGLDLELTDAQVRALAKGVRRVSFGLLDIAVAGPKMQFLIDHEDWSALPPALARAFKDESDTVRSIQEYEQTKIYEIHLPPGETAQTPNRAIPFGARPFAGRGGAADWILGKDIWLAFVGKRRAIIATSANAVKDALDFIEFPDDPVDTLLGNKRYREALKEFKEPTGLFFANVQALINTTERLSGDKGSSPIFQMLAGQLGIDDSMVEFGMGLIQYEQFKSFAAGFWIDRDNLTLRAEAVLHFHNAPGWFEALRIQPSKQPLTELIPAETIFAMTEGIDEPEKLWNSFRDYLIENAREAGQTKIVDAIEKAEKELEQDDMAPTELLSHLSGGQGFVVLPDPHGGNTPVVAGMFQLKDHLAFREYFFKKLIPALKAAGASLDDEGTTIEYIEGVEVHVRGDRLAAFATLKDADKDGVESPGGAFVIGQYAALRRIIEARAQGQTLANLQSYKEARGLLWEKCSLSMYLNFGSFLTMISNAMRFGVEEEEVGPKDPTRKDKDPIRYLSEFFRDTVVVGGARSAERKVTVRTSVAGWPARERFRGLISHFRDVERNETVRDDLVRLLESAETAYVLTGATPASLKELEEAGYLDDPETAKDPYGGAEDAKRRYVIVKCPDQADIRQAILLAHQREPGLRMRHLAILWNGDVVALTPEELKDAIEKAKNGEPLEDYQPLDPLYRKVPGSTEDWMEFPEPDANKVEVEIIDDEGNESSEEVDVDKAIEETEKAIDSKESSK